MTRAEMNRRLETLTTGQIDQIIRMINEGYGEIGIVNNTVFSRKQINAVFQYVNAAR